MVAPALLVVLAGQVGNSDPGILLLILAIFFFLLIARRRRRSRYIPAKSKRLAQARLIQKHYSDPQTATKPLRLRDYEYDHKRPFSRGGSADPENIELIKRKENRRKGNKW